MGSAEPRKHADETIHLDFEPTTKVEVFLPCLVSCILIQVGDTEENTVGVDVLPHGRYKCDVERDTLIAVLVDGLSKQLAQPDDATTPNSSPVCLAFDQNHAYTAASADLDYERKIIVDYGSDGCNDLIVSGSPVAEVARFVQVFRQVTKYPDNGHLRVRDIDCLIPAEFDQIMDWNSATPPLQASCIHDLFDARALIQPHSPAVTSDAESIDYETLQEATTDLAIRLWQAGIRAGSFVPVCAPKSISVTVAMLSLLKAGATVVLLDINHPDQRLLEIIETLDCQTIVLSHDQVNRFPASSIEKFILDEGDVGSRNPGVYGAGAVLPLVSSQTPAFAIFSSGSTGTPKAILLSHEAICTSAITQAEAMGINGQSRALQFASYAFDVSIYETLIPLVHGGCVCVPSETQRLTGLADFITRHDINWATLTPSVVSTLDPSDVPSLRVLNFTGECASQEAVDLWAHKLLLVNAYGSTEASTCALARLLPRSPPNWIGQLIGCRSWIVHPEDPVKLVRPGHVGELLVQGHVVASEYLNDLPKTSAAFLQPPTWLAGSSTALNGRSPRLFRTGDLARYCDSHGSILYLGRKDSQIRLRGHRVEPSFVETKIRGLPPHYENVVLDISPPGTHDKVLAAFLVVRRMETGEHQESGGLVIPDNAAVEQLVALRSELSGKLPAYMIPAAFITVPAIPTTLTRKTDFRALRKLAAAITPDQFERYMLRHAPLTLANGAMTPMEREMKMLWSRALERDVSGIGSTTSFLAVGGDSIKAIRLVSLARNSGYTLDYAAVLGASTLGAMARMMMRHETGPTKVHLEPFALLGLMNDQLKDQIIGEIHARHSPIQHTVEDAYPCTPLQEGILALSMKQEGTYLAQNIFELARDVELHDFRAAWEVVVEHADCLRSRYVMLPSGAILQTVVSAANEWQSADCLRTYLASDEQSYFHLGDTTSRFALISETSGKVYFVWTVHHASYDAWTVKLLTNLVQLVYHNDELPSPTPYSRLVKYILDRDRTASADFWSSYLSDIEAAPFPIQAAQWAHDHMREQRVRRTIQYSSRPLSGITDSTYVQAAWALILSQHTTSNDVTFGQILSGRNADLDGIDQITGLVSTTVPVRIKLNSESSVQQLLQAVQDDMLSMTPHQQFGLQNIKKLSEDANTACSFQNMLIIDYDGGLDDGQIATDTTILTEVSIGEVSSKTYPLHVQCSIRSCRVDVEIRFDDHVLNVVQVERLIQQLEHVLSQLTNLQARVGEIQVITAGEKSQIMRWNAQPLVLDNTPSHRIITDWVKTQPNANAVDGHDAKLTYEELDQQSSQMASQLLEMNSVGQKILLCFRKSTWAVVAMLGVLKAGAAFVPLDHSHPTERLLTIGRQCNARIVITTADQSYRFESQFNQIVILTGKLPLDSSNKLDLPRVDPQSDAYVIFTSGTTGKPKGVTIQHCALSSSLAWQGEVMQMKPDTRALQFASYAFDAMVLETIMILAHGGCICVPSEDQRLQVEEVINKKNINWAALNPSVAATVNPKHVPSLKTLVVGGEPLSLDLASRWAAEVSMFNMCGPTEATVFCCGTQVTPESPDPQSIGICRQSHSWIVHPNDINCLLPLGAVGELVIEGPILSRGYLDDDERSRANFVKHPEWICAPWKPGAIVYRTGDLVSYDEDGSLKIWGRKDTQVKIRGNRIELSEIEQHLRKILPNAVFVGVELTKDEGGSQFLASFICKTNRFVVASEVDSTLIQTGEEVIDQFRRIEGTLRTSLPGYMIPATWSELRAVPVTTSGKVNKGILRQLARGVRASTTEERGLSSSTVLTPKQQQLASLWTKVLLVEESRIRTNSHFLALGGDSIAAMRLSAFCKDISLSLTVKDIFQNLELSRMASRMVPILPETGPAPIFQLPSPDEQVFAQYSLDSCQVLSVFPCSVMQEALLTLSLQQPGTYVLRATYHLPDDIDIQRFRSAWEVVHQHHDILRTTFILDQSSTYWSVVTSRGVEWQTQEQPPITAAKPTVLGLGSPMTRYYLSEKLFTLTIHHASYDGWTLKRIISDVEAVYKGGAPGATASMRPFIMQIQEQDEQATSRYWKRQLANCSAVAYPPLPTPDHSPRADMMLQNSFRFVSADAVAAISTPANIIRAAWILLLAQYSGSDDVVIGVTLNGRGVDSVPNIMDIMGPTMATVPVRAICDRSVPVLHFLNHLQDQAAEMSTFEQFGIHNIRKLSAHTAIACDFQFILSVDTVDVADEHAAVLNRSNAVNEPSNFHANGMTVECNIGRDCLTIIVYFDSAMIPERQVHRMMRHFQNGLEQIGSVSTNSITINDLDWTGQAEVAEMTHIAPSLLECEPRCVHDEIQLTTNRFPRNQAICAWDGALTYQELDHLAINLAKHLVHLVNPGDHVLASFEKSVWAVVSMLAILKAGAVYVPLDPGYPRLRCEQIAGATQAKAVLCSPASTDLCTGLTEAILTITATSSQLSVSDPNTSLPVVAPHHNCFVLFTSGSTGQPKGIMIEHAGFCYGARHHSHALNISSSSRVFQFAAHVFDISFSDIFATLMKGGCVCVPSESDRLNDLSGAINRLQATQVFLTPTVASILDPSLTPKLGQLVIGGEAPTQQVLERWSTRVHLIMIWGPAECTVYSSFWPHAKPDDNPACIGRPIGCNIWVTKEDDPERLAPLGTVGELLVEGPVVARGYINDQTRTADAFIVNPKWTESDLSPGQVRRFYRTADLGRFMPDGTIQFAGRRDAQVKIRGQRVELGEIEHQVRSHKAVGHVVVCWPAAGYLTRQLVAVITLNDGAAPVGAEIQDQNLETVSHREAQESAVEVRKHIAERLPQYMIPEIIIVVRDMPKMVSRKLNRAAVKTWLETAVSRSDVSAMRMEPGTEFDEAPTGEVERALRRIWAAVLGSPESDIGRHATFFSLGGDSITAIQIVAKAAEVDIKLTVRDIMKQRTIAKLAALPNIRQESPSPRIVNDIGSVPRGRMPLSPQQSALFSVMKQRSLRFNQSFLLGLRRPLVMEALQSALFRIVDVHPMLRARFLWDLKDAGWYQTVEEGASCAILQHSEPVRIEDLSGIIEQTHQKIDISSGPIIAAALFNLQLSTSDIIQAVLLVSSHLVIDLYSWRIILEELESTLMDRSLPLQAENISYPTWSARQGDLSQSGLHARLPASTEALDVEAYWQLEDDISYGHLDTWSFRLSETSTRAIFAESNQAYNTDPVEIMVACLVHSFLLTFADRDAVAVHCESHGRQNSANDTDLARTVGWFTVMIPVMLMANDSSSLLDTIRQTKDTMRINRGTRMHEFIAAPVEILFNYAGKYQQLDAPGALFNNLHIPNLTLEDFDVDKSIRPFALFDISVSASERNLDWVFRYPKVSPRAAEFKTWFATCQQVLESVPQLLATRVPEPTLIDCPGLTSYDVLDETINVLHRSGSVANAEYIYPAAPIQQQMLNGTYADPRIYVVKSIFRLLPAEGTQFDVERFKRAWAEIISRYDIMRTCFVKVRTEPHNQYLQVVAKKMQSDVLYHGQISETPIDCLNALPSLTMATDLAKCHRWDIVHTSAGQILGQLQMFHGIIDGVSIRLMLECLCRQYGGEGTVRAAPPFRAYTQLIGSTDVQESVEYWTRKLSKADQCHLGSFDMALRRRDRFHVRIVHSEHQSKVAKFSQEHGLMPSVLFHMAWAMVLRRTLGVEAPCFVSVLAGRDEALEGIDEAVGPYLKFLPFCVEVDAEGTLQDRLGSLQQAILNGLGHQKASLDHVRVHMNLDKLPFDSAVNYQGTTMQDRTEEGVEPQLRIKHVDAKDPMEWNIMFRIVKESDGNFSLTLEYWTPNIAHDLACEIGTLIDHCLGVLVDSKVNNIWKPHKPVRA